MESKCGRYASSSLTISGDVIIAGGMTFCNGDHKVMAICNGKHKEKVNQFKQKTHISRQVTANIKKLKTKVRTGENYWKETDVMRSPRAFFCIVDLMDSDIFATGMILFKVMNVDSLL